MKIQKEKNKHGSALKVTLLIFLMVIAAAGGIICAKVYTTPYSNVSESFQEGTLDEVVLSKEKCNILIMGTDASGMLTDVMMLAQIDPVKNTATVLSIPRDTYFNYNGSNTRINAVHAEMQRRNKTGSESAILAVKELTGIPVHHYVKFNTKAFRQCIDELGGVDFDVPQRMKYKDPMQDLDIDLQPGMQHLDGDKAEQLVRFRSYPFGDIDRIKVQQSFLHAIAEQKLKMSYVGKIDDIYSVVIRNLETSMSPDDLLQCGTQLLDVGTDNIQTVTLPHSFVNGESYVVPVYAEIEKVRRNNFGYGENGEDISEEIQGEDTASSIQDEDAE